MKKYLFKQTKKAFSLFLAVVMLMSCWVWMAPEKAEAGSIQAKTSYTIEVLYSVSNGTFKGGYINLGYRTNHGWGNETIPDPQKTTPVLNSFQGTDPVSKTGWGASGEHTFSYKFEDGKFPTRVQVHGENSEAEVCGISSEARLDVTEIRINGKTVMTSTEGFNKSGTVDIGVSYADNNDVNGSYYNSSTNPVTATWPRPAIYGFSNDSAKADTKVDNKLVNPEINVNLGAIGTDPAFGTTRFNVSDTSKYTFYTQYDLIVSPNFPYEYIGATRYAGEFKADTYVADEAGESLGDDLKALFSIKDLSTGDTQVSVNPNLQTITEAGSPGASYNLVRTYTVESPFPDIDPEVSMAAAKINIQYPQYTATVRVKGTVNDGEFAPSIGGTAYDDFTSSDYYGGEFSFPADATADGYSFYGYWSSTQPTSGSGWFYNKTAAFAEPVSSTDFEDYVNNGENAETKEDGKVVLVEVDEEEDGIDVDNDGIKEKAYYDAGIRLDPDNVDHTTVKGDVTWHAWWCSNDYDVKFYDVDGKYLDKIVVKHGQYGKDIEWPESEYKNTGYTSTNGSFRYIIDEKNWIDTDGTDVNVETYRFTKPLILTPKLKEGEFKSKYEVAFIHPLNGTVVDPDTGVSRDDVLKYDYRDNIEISVAKKAQGHIPANLNSKYASDLEYSYVFAGWTTQVPNKDENGNIINYYHIIKENGDFDQDGKAIALNKDWIVRDDVTYYAVYRLQTKTYTVNFKFSDDRGNDVTVSKEVKYNGSVTAPWENVPFVYNAGGFEYTFSEWKYKDNEGNEQSFAYTGNISINEYTVKLQSTTEPVNITAVYSDPVWKPYTVSFSYVDANNNQEVSEKISVSVGNAIGEEIDKVNLNIIPTMDDGKEVSYYADKWEFISGSGEFADEPDKEYGANNANNIIDSDRLSDFIPLSNVELKPVYANPVPYHNVTFIDRGTTKVEKALRGSNMPVCEYVPEDYKADGGTYVFSGWYDAKEGGTPITDEAYKLVAGDHTFYAQFNFVPDTFLITFKAYDGTVLYEDEFEKGESLEDITADAVADAEVRASSDKYNYTFIGWDNPVPKFCEGKPMVFTALYKESYRYYDVKWYNSRLEDGKWVADKSTSTVEGKEVETYLLATTKHTYESKLYTPSVDAIECLETAPNGQSYVFAGWYYNDAEGNAHKYQRGMKVTSEMEFYATYTLTAKTFTVTAMVDGKPTDYTVASGNKVELSDPQDGYKDETYHSEFKGWYTDEACTVEFDADTAITENTTVYAKFETSEHSFTNSLTKTYPTYYATGEKEIWCSCDPSRAKTEIIPMLEDNVKPTGTIYLGSLGEWSSTDEVGAAASDGEDVKLVANADTDIIITTNDTGKKCTPETHTEENCEDCAYDALYNPSSTGKGVKLIRAFVYPGDKALTADGFGAAQDVAITVYENNTEDLTNNANFAVKLGAAVAPVLDENGNAVRNEDGTVKIASLENGKVYIVYYYVVDKAGNELNTKVRTAKFIYDNEAPVFTVTGHNNEAAIPTYCGTATVENIEADTIVKVNGDIVDVTDGKHVINYEKGLDNILITVTDKAGNTATKKIKISDHIYDKKEVLAGCTTPGYSELICAICDDKKDKVEYPATGHGTIEDGTAEWYVKTEADCVNPGEKVLRCLNDGCGLELDTEVIPATGHGSVEEGTAEWYVKTEADCINSGEKALRCLNDGCGVELDTEVIPAAGHTFTVDENDEIVYDTIRASTCMEKGMAEAVCIVCEGALTDGRKVKELDLDPLNHVKVTISEKAATCVEPGYYTKTCECGNYPTNENKTFEPTGKHILIIKNKETDVKEPTKDEDGFIKWSCSTCSYTETKTYPALSGDITVTFKTEDANTVLEEFTGLFAGETIGATEETTVVAPEKAETVEERFTFAGWKDEDGKIVKLPLTVTEDMVLTAYYKATPIIYTHKFKVPTAYISTLSETEEYKFDSYVEYTVLIGAYGDVLKPSSEPVFKASDDIAKKFTFEFIGWNDGEKFIAKDAQDASDAYKVKGDATFTAVFTAIPVKYDVIYYNGSEYVWSTKVDGGKSAVFAGDTPEKALDDKYHYEFDKWYTDASLETPYGGEEIIGKTQLYAGFKAIEHSYEVAKDAEGNEIIIQQATCLLPELKKAICTCGHTKTVEGKPATGHVDENGKSTLTTVEEERDDGIYEVVKCTVCGTEDSATKISYTVVFKNSNGVTLQTSVLKRGSEIKYEKAEPTLADTENKSYKFKGWYVEGDENKTPVTLGIATEDIVYIADYTETEKTFRLTFVDENNNTITTKAGLAYKYELTAEDFPADLKDYQTKNDHYTFEGWTASVGDEIKADLIVKPVFDVEAHKWEKSDDYAEPDCEQGGGIVWVCTVCGATETRDGVATGHKWVEKEGSRVEPVGETDGYYYNVCTVCGKTSEKIIIPAAKKRDIVITVKDSNGKAILGALVELYQNGTRVAVADTNADGKVTFQAYEGKYKVLVSGVADAQNVTFDFTLGNKGYNGEAIMQITEETCECSCHRDGFWGIVFRFFHKIIAFFTGSIRCCSCPDGRY